MYINTTFVYQIDADINYRVNYPLKHLRNGKFHILTYMCGFVFIYSCKPLCRPDLNIFYVNHIMYTNIQI